MRIDLTLKHLCLAKSRSLVKGWCERKLVTINGRTVSASSSVRPGDRVSIRYATHTLTIELRGVPAKQVSRLEATDYYVEVGSTGA